MKHKRTKTELLLVELKLLADPAGVTIAIHDPTADFDYAIIRLSWESVGELKRWLGRRLREKAGDVQETHVGEK